jgi:hypothetical protein
MTNRRIERSLVVSLALAGLVLLMFPAPSQSRAKDRLDDFDDKRLEKDLYAELRPIYNMGDKPDTIEDLEDKIYQCLTDEDHQGDEDAITGEDLEDEMEEAPPDAGCTEKHSCLEDVIDQALEGLAAGRAAAPRVPALLPVAQHQRDRQLSPRQAEMATVRAIVGVKDAANGNR